MQQPATAATTTTTPADEANVPCPARRHAAGADPAKRDQILDGAMQVFRDAGFDAASMNDICRAAGVSKGTVYVYFDGKEDLFVSVIERERDRMFADVDKLLAGELPFEDKLLAYGRHIAGVLCSDKVIRVSRAIAAVADRMPELGARFYDAGSYRSQAGLRRLFADEAAAGRLDVSDPVHAAYQFTELAVAGIWRQRLFGKLAEEPSQEQLSATVTSAVAMFLARYRIAAAG